MIRFSFVIATITLCVIVGGVNHEHIRGSKCGDSLTWDLSIGILSISGTGNMYNYTAGTAPWYEYLEFITSIDVQQGVTSIGNYAFYQCDQVTELRVPEGLTTIGSYAFSKCSSLEELTLSSTVSSIEISAFLTCPSLKSIDVDSSSDSKYISINGVLIDNKSHTLVKYPEGKTDSTYTVPDSVLSVGDSAFYDCDNLIHVIFLQGVKTLGDAAFYHCSGLDSIILPSTLTSIGSQAFDQCAELKNITIPAKVVSIGAYAFDRCASLTSIDVETGNTRYESDDGALIDFVSRTLIHYPAGKSSTSYTIPSTVTTIGLNAFWYSEKLTTVIIPEGVTTIQDGAFSDCTGLTSIIIPESVDFILSRAFSSCSSLNSVFYQGSTVISTTGVFTKSVTTVCVSPDYKYQSFCDLPVTASSETCKNFMYFFNNCYKGSVEDETIIFPEKRKNATNWEDQTNECIEYRCNNESGQLKRSICNSTDGVNLMCVKGRCVDENEFNEKQWTVEIEIGDVEVLDVNADDVAESIFLLTGVKKEEITVGIENDENGLVIKIVLFTDKEETAKTISKAVDAMNKGKGCKYGTLCHAKSVRVIANGSQMLSNERQIVMDTICFMILLLRILDAHIF